MATRYTKAIRPGRYTVLKFPNLKAPDLHKVKVISVYRNELHDRIVEFRFNWPLPITEHMAEREFQKIVAEEVK